jgi:hypothetical protein
MFLSDLLRDLRGGVRLAALQRVARADFVATPEAFALLVASNLVVLLLLGLATTGLDGRFNYFELPRALMGVPLVLAFGLLVARVNDDPASMLMLPVALTAAGTVIGIVVGAVDLLARAVEPGPGEYWSRLHYFAYGWWIVVIAVTVWRLAPTNLKRRAGNVAAGLVLIVLPGWLLPQGYLWVPAHDSEAGYRPGMWALADESGFYAQHDMLASALADLRPERRGIPDLYVIAAGLYASEDVFMKEVKVIEALFRERFDADGRVLALINNPQTVHEYPVASLTSLAAALKRVGSLMNPDEDVLVLYVSSHGTEAHKLSVDFWPLRLDYVDPAALKRMFHESGIKWKIVVVSACYSGGFIEPLKDEHTLIITASRADKQSFGCGSDSDATYLAKALFDEELRGSYSFEQAFENARRSIARREKEQNFAPSEPQIYVGGAVREKLRQVERRLAGRASEPSE